MRRTSYILYDQYEKSDLCKVAPNNKQLTEDKRNALHNILTKYEFLFNITLGT